MLTAALLHQAEVDGPVRLDGLIVDANLFRGDGVVAPAWASVAAMLPPPPGARPPTADALPV